MSTPFVVMLSKFFAVVIIIAITSIIMKIKRFPDLDSYTIGYIQEPINTNVCVQIDAQLDYKNTQLYADCRDALVSLGIKKREATQKTNSTFNKQIPSDVTSFLREALK